VAGTFTAPRPVDTAKPFQGTVARSEQHSTAPAKAGKPAKPNPDFPLFAHAAGVWAKKIRGKLYSFGPRDDPQGALKKLREGVQLGQQLQAHEGRHPGQGDA
jgi:hypothetical protein